MKFKEKVKKFYKDHEVIIDLTLFTTALVLETGLTLYLGYQIGEEKGYKLGYAKGETSIIRKDYVHDIRSELVHEIVNAGDKGIAFTNRTLGKRTLLLATTMDL